MKGLLILISVFLFAACTSETNPIAIESAFFGCYDPEAFGPLQPENFNGLPAGCMNEVFSESFDQAGEWYKRSDAEYTIQVKNGVYFMESKINSNFYVYYSSLYAGTDGFQVEADLDLSSTSANANSGINFGGKDGLDNLYFAGITTDGRFIVGHIIDNMAQTPLQALTPSPAIRTTGTNRLALRFFEGRVYFFINETLVFDRDFTPYGNEIGFKVGANSKAEFDQLSIKSFAL